MPETKLPIIDERTVVRRPIGSILVHAIRVCAVGCLLALLPSPHSATGPALAGDSVGPSQPVDNGGLTQWVQQFHPEVKSLSVAVDEHGLWTAVGDDGNVRCRVARTLPAGSDSRGYRGPTEALLLFDAKETLSGVAIIGSHDTDEHVDAVANDKAFLNQFKGLTWGGLDSTGRAPEIDGVSGATLTSLAMAEGVLARLGKTGSSLVFREPLAINEALSMFPAAIAIDGDPVARVQDSQGFVLGTLVRTGEILEGDVGYQGPTELLLAFDVDQTLFAAQIRGSYDNEPYVSYVREDSYFWSLVTGMKIDQLALWDPEDQQVEGVSGATMTSMAVAQTLPHVAREIDRAGGLEAWSTRGKDSVWRRVAQFISYPVLSASDLGTVAMLVVLLVGSWQGWMRRKRFRFVWLVAVIWGIGFWSGNLISIALIAGWASAGVSWHLAIGLVGLCAVAFVIPPATRGNPYCNHLCPHGAIQQLFRPGQKSKRHLHLPPLVNRVLSWLPPMTLVAAYLVLLFRPSSDVTKLEPFHAYLWPMASLVTVLFAVATIAFSLFIPMGYCRFGCPTGYLIGYLRRTSLSHRISRNDWAIAALLALSIGAYVIR